MIKRKRHYEPLFEIHINVMWGGKAVDAAAMVGFVEGASDPEMEGFVQPNGDEYTIWMRKCTMKNFQHEFTHLVHAIYRDHGVCVNYEHDELDARWRSQLADTIWRTCKP